MGMSIDAGNFMREAFPADRALKRRCEGPATQRSGEVDAYDRDTGDECVALRVGERVDREDEQPAGQFVDDNGASPGCRLTRCWTTRESASVTGPTGSTSRRVPGDVWSLGCRSGRGPSRGILHQRWAR